MKKMMRKILAVLVVFSVVLSVGIIAMQGGSLADNGIYYQNDFSGALDAENWSNSGAMSVSGGVLTISKTSYLDLASVENISNYVVEAKISMDDSAHNVKMPTAGIVMYTNASNKGYEFTLLRAYSATTGGTLNGSYVRFYNRINTSAQFDGYTDMLKNQVEANRQYTLKMVANGNKIDCYVDGVLLKTFEGITATAGGVGFNVNGCVATVDDFIVRKPTAAELGQDETSSEASSDTSSAAQDIYFSENFDTTDAFANSGWQVAGVDTALDAGRVVNGQYKLGGKGVSPIYYDLSGNTALDGVLDYTIEADVRVDTTTDINGKTVCFAGVNGRAVNGAGVEFSLVFNADGTGYVRLYDRVEKVALGDKILNGQILGNQIYTLKLVCAGDTAKGYVDGVLVAEGKIPAKRLTKGAPSIKSQDCFDAYIDNFVVRKPTQKELSDRLEDVTSSDVTSTTTSTPTGTTSSNTSSTSSNTSSTSSNTSSGSTSSGSTLPDGYYFYEPFENDSQFANQGWSTKPTAAQLVAGHSGLQFAKPTKTTVYVMKNNATLNALADYVVEADVMVDDTAASSVEQPIAGIIGRYSDGNGIELCLYFNTTNGANYVRFHDRKGGKVYSEKIMEGELQGNTVYKLKMAFNGSTVRCYVDGELMLTVTDIATTAPGTVGFRGNGYPAYYDNLVVRPATDEEKGILAPAQKPVADQNGVYYANNFEDLSILQDTNWANPILNVEDGKALLVKGYNATTNLISNRDFALLDDYVVEATIEIDPTSEADISRPIIALMGRANSGSQGYELGLMGTADGTQHWVRLYNRITGESMAEVPVVAERGKSYTLRLVMIGNTIRGYFDDQKVIELAGTGILSGSAGYRANGIGATMDRFVLRKPTAAEIKGESGQVSGGNDPTPSTGDSLTVLMTVLTVLLAAAGTLLVCKKVQFTHK